MRNCQIARSSPLVCEC